LTHVTQKTRKHVVIQSFDVELGANQLVLTKKQKKTCFLGKCSMKKMMNLLFLSSKKRPILSHNLEISQELLSHSDSLVIYFEQINGSMNSCESQGCDLDQPSLYNMKIKYRIPIE